MLNDPSKYSEMCFSNVWGSEGRRKPHSLDDMSWERCKVKKKKESTHKKESKNLWKSFHSRETFFCPPYDHGYDVFSF